MELTEEALQQSAALSGSDVEAYGANDNAAEGPSRPHPNSVGHTPHPPAHDHVEMSDRNEAMLQGSGTTVPVKAAGGSAAVEDDDEDADGEADDDYDFMNGEATLQAEYANKDDGATPAAAEGNTDDEDEGVGAVKIRPGETDDDEDHESEISVHTASEGESDGGDEWEAGEEAVEVDDDESDNVQLNTCMFCKRDEENDPGEEFATYLACSSCGDHAHQHCARKAGSMLTKTIPSKWKCPECATDDDDALHLESDDAMSRVSDTSTVVPDAQMSLPPDADAIGSLETVLEDDALNSSANQQASDGDVTEGSRRLRKRKTPSVDGDDDVISLRKRRRQTTTERPLSREGTPEDDLSQPQSSRTLRLRAPRQKTVDISRLSPASLLVTIRTKPESMREALSQRYIPERRRTSRAAASRTPRVNGTRAREPSPEPLIAPFVSTTYSQPFYSFFDKESDDAKGKPYGGILSEAEAATTKTMPSNEDRCRFDEAKQRAEAEWKARIISMQEEIQMPAKKKKAAGPGSQIECVEFGGWEIDTWYAAPYPEEYSRNRVLYICEFCLKYMNSDYVAWRHKLKCASKHPPGDEIYRDASVSVFEVDGRKNPVYCQNLCLLAKLFLGSKTLYYDVESFLFYVLCEYDEFGYHFVGYFSKEKRASSQNNVSCILTLPIHQRKGYGNLLIDFSYLLTKAEGRTGSPEKPLSDMGLVSYRNYWRLIMCRYLLENAADEKSRSSGLSIRKISDDTGMTADDVISALEGLRCLVRDAQTGLYAFRVDLQFCREYVQKWEAKNYVKLNPAGLTWTAYVMGSSSALNLELGPAISAIAPREEDGGESQAVEVLTDAKAVAGLSNGHSKEVEAEDTKVDVGEMVNAGPSDDKENRDESASAEGKGKGKGKGEGGGEGDTQGQATGSAAEVDENWAAAYRDIPPTRFAVFPPVVSGRRVERSRSRAARAPSFTATNTATPRPRASASVSSTSSRRKSSAARPRSSASRRKSGGTGRGPGRWPKGTKKSDYGNADSGPGLPPAWIERNKSLGLAPGSPATRDGGGPASGDDGMTEMKDEVRVQVDKGDGDSVVVNPSRRSEALSFASVDEAVAVVGATEAVGDGEVDAEGEEE